VNSVPFRYDRAVSRRRAPVIVLLAALVGAGAVLLAPPTIVAGKHAMALRVVPNAGVRWLRDDFDLAVYAQRGSFALLPGARPYVEVPCEYPVLAAYLFALPFAFADTFPGYRAAFTVLMALVLGALGFVLAELARAQAQSPLRALCLLLPGTLYFSLNRFDAVPVLLSAAALLSLWRARWALAFALLAAAVLTKAYPVLYLPLFARYALGAGGRRALVHGLVAFAAVVAGLALQLALWAGPEAVLAPFRFQLGRMQNAESLYYLLARALPVLDSSFGRGLFTVLQLAPAVLAGLARPTTAQNALRWMTAITVAFVLFSRFQSPQWLVWITPLAALAARSRAELALVFALDVVTFAYFPWAYDALGPRAAAFTALIALLSALRVLHQGVLLWKLPFATGGDASLPLSSVEPKLADPKQ
jgi:hypothetical protein